MTLRQTQTHFQDFLLGKDDTFRDQVSNGPRADKDKMLAVYHHAYRARLIECLGENFNITWTFLGDEGFEQLCLDYIAAQPSTFRNLRWFGHELADHAAKTEPWSNHPVLAELIAFEWGLRSVFDAADSDVALLEHMAIIPPEAWPDLTFDLVPSLLLLDLNWNAAPIWRALDQEETPPAPQQESYAQTWLLWRKGLVSQYRSLDGVEAEALRLVQKGGSFAALCDILTLRLGDAELAAQTAAGYLRQWIEDALISHISP